MKKLEKILDEFKWESLGNIGEGRQNMGDQVSVLAYRLLQFSFKKVMELSLGEEKTVELFREAGWLAGMTFSEKFLDKTLPFSAFAAQLQKVFREEKIGILQFEETNVDTLDMILTVSEDLDCSGLPVAGETVCDYDEGLIAGILSYYTGRDFDVREIDCWATGGRVCRFTVHVKA